MTTARSAPPPERWLAERAQLWAGSDEWEPWTDRPAIQVTGSRPSRSFAWLLEVHTVEDWPQGYLFGVPEVVGPWPTSVGVIVFEVPAEWDGIRPLDLADLKWAGEATVGPDRDALPYLSDERREKRRKGWAW